MDRIMRRLPDGNITVVACHDALLEDRCDEDCPNCDVDGMINNKLSLYEDSDLTPEEVAALAAAKREGRLVVMPDELIVPYELSDRYWICGWDLEHSTLTIQDRVLAGRTGDHDR